MTNNPKISQIAIYCPRCDRPYFGVFSYEGVLDRVKAHVREQHPDHDPFWYETYPEDN